MPTLKRFNQLTVIVGLLVATWSVRSLAQESRGVRFNNLSVSPYVNLDYTYDSNVNVDNNSGNYKDAEQADSILRITPGVDLSYSGNEWGLKGNGWFSYDKYMEQDQLDKKSYGESLDFYRESPSGWRFVLGQKYLKSNQDDSLADGGRGQFRNRDELSLNSALSYQVSEKMGVTLSGMYSDLSYNNDSNQYSPLYGWKEWSTGLEFAYKVTEKSNVLLNGGYQAYTSDGAKGISSDSTGYSLMAGLGSAATKRITYRVLTGASWFDYADGDQMVGWTYSLDSSWVINKKVAVTVAGSSYFQPSEREQNQAMQVYALSTGLTYRPMRKLTTRCDIAYRREENQIDTASSAGETQDQVSFRTRADYQLQRFVTLYGGIEYMTQTSDNSVNEYDRYRASLGLNLRY